MEYTAESWHERPYRTRVRATLKQWFGVLAGPIAWLLSLNLSFSLVLPACAAQTFLPMHVVSAVMLSLALFGGYVAAGEWKSADGVWPDARGGAVARTRIMAAMGLLNSALFSFAILGQWLSNLFLNPCMGI